MIEVEALKKVALEALQTLKAVDVVDINVRDMTSVTDYMLIASGTSSRHVKSIADAVIVACKKSGATPLGVEGEREGEWVLVDLGDVVIHVMRPAVREFYGLEKIWAVTEESREQSHR